MQRQIFRKVALDRLASPEQLDQLLQVTRPTGWLALAALYTLLAAAVLWSIFGSIAVQVSGRAALVAPASGRMLEALVFVPARAAQQVRPGMPARVVPAGTGRERYGFMRGTVVSVDAAWAADAGTTARLATTLGIDSSAIAIHVALVPDPAAMSGYAWSLPPGPPTALASGTPGEATIVVDERRPISFVLPRKEQ
jgi:hypothetical protein